MNQMHYIHGTEGKTGVLLVNLGTPEAPTRRAVKRFLAEFLMDRRVVEINPFFWWLILHGVILNIRPQKTALNYKKIWRAEGSPLMYYSQNQQKELQVQLDRRLKRPVITALGMRYGQPSIGEALKELRANGARRILILPMYPQYSATTTASVYDAVADELKRWRWIPELRFITQYHDEPGYIQSLVSSIQEHWQAFGRAERLLFSFHSIPKAYFDAGDPYPCLCDKTARLVAESLGLSDDQWMVVYQSRVGTQEWLKPYTDITLEQLPKKGVKSVDVVCPGFSVDCLETLEEIAIADREIFLKAGGERYHYISALNDRTDHIQALSDVVIKGLQGWPETDPNWHPSKEASAREQEREFAMAKGAKQ